MSKSHLKRIKLPRTWAVPRKSLNRNRLKFISKPNAGKDRNWCMSINTFLKEGTGLAKTTKEVKAMLQFKHVFVNGNRVRDDKFPVGLFDVVSFEEIDDCYRLVLNKFGKLAAIKIDAKEKDILLKQIEGKTVLKGGKLQLNLSASANLIVEKDQGATGDVIVLKNGKIDKVLPLKKGSQVMLIAGRHIGSIASVTEIQENKIFIDVDGNNVETLKEFAFVVGDKKPIVAVTQ